MHAGESNPYCIPAEVAWQADAKLLDEGGFHTAIPFLRNAKGSWGSKKAKPPPYIDVGRINFRSGGVKDNFEQFNWASGLYEHDVTVNKQNFWKVTLEYQYSTFKAKNQADVARQNQVEMEIQKMNHGIALTNRKSEDDAQRQQIAAAHDILDSNNQHLEWVRRQAAANAQLHMTAQQRQNAENMEVEREQSRVPFEPDMDFNEGRTRARESQDSQGMGELAMYNSRDAGTTAAGTKLPPHSNPFDSFGNNQIALQNAIHDGDQGKASNTHFIHGRHAARYRSHLSHRRHLSHDGLAEIRPVLSPDATHTGWSEGNGPARTLPGSMNV